MHTRELIELGALVAVHSSTLLSRTEPWPELGTDIQRYWTTSKCRLDRWSRMLRTYSDEIQSAAGDHRRVLWQQIRPTLEEILTGELLTRIWSAFTNTLDLRRGVSELEPVARSVHIGHLEARNRALSMMVYGQGFGIEEAVALNRLRRRVERWTDLLLGVLGGVEHAADLAFDIHRVRQFANDPPLESSSSDLLPQQLIFASLRAAFQNGLSSASPNADLNEQIAAAILGCLPPESFDSLGLPKSLWLMRLSSVTAEMQGLIDQLLALDERRPVSCDLKAPPSLRQRTRRF